MYHLMHNLMIYLMCKSTFMLDLHKIYYNTCIYHIKEKTMNKSIENLFKNGFNIRNDKFIIKATEELIKKTKEIQNIEQICRIINTVGNKYFQDSCEEDVLSPSIKYQHEFIVKYGGEIIKLYKKGYSPNKILKLPRYKNFKKPSSATIRNYLISENKWEFNKQSIKATPMIKLQKIRSKIKDYHFNGTSVDITIVHMKKYNDLSDINDHTIDIYIKKEYERLTLQSECASEIYELLYVGNTFKYIYDKLKASQKYKKVITWNLIKTTKKDF